MPLKITCPSCKAPVPLDEPYPMPGAMRQCTACGKTAAVTYPQGVIEQLQQRGKRFASDGSAAHPRAIPADPTAVEFDRLSHPGTSAGVPRASLPKPPAGVPAPPATPATEPTLATELYDDAYDASALVADAIDADASSMVATHVDPTIAGDLEPADRYHQADRTVPAMRTPYGDLPGQIPEADAPAGMRHDWRADDGAADGADDARLGALPIPPRADAPATATQGAPVSTAKPKPPPATRKKSATPKGSAKRATPAGAAPAKGGCLKRLGCMSGGCFSTTLIVLLLLVVLGAGGVGGVFWYYSQDLPTVETLRGYEPPTVTTLYDQKGEILGEIYEQRRYVRPLDEIPKHVQDAFVAAEDANFWNHGGVDYMGIIRAVLRNAAAGRKAQGASTITQQVAKNFLLTRDKALERKIKEAILSWRIEAAYTKEHILYLYLNEIFLGSQAYGVEAASRTFFGKSVDQVTVAEAAILAGLPPRPSDYGPHRSWAKAKERQSYVLGQMLAKGYIDQPTYEAAMVEDITVVRRANSFLEQAPHFTEHVRRYLVDKYGEETVLNGGLQVTTTCDLGLQKHAQAVVRDQVFEVDQRIGFRRAALETLTTDAAIAKRREEHETAMRTEQRDQRDAAGGRTPLPDRSVVTVGQVYPAVLLEVSKTWARVGLGDHEGIIPLAWSKWVYQPNPKQSYRFREAKDLTDKVAVIEGGQKDTPILQKGDVVLVRVEDLSTKAVAAAKTFKGQRGDAIFKGTPGEAKDLVALHLWQIPEVEGALLAMDVADGSIRAMVGGADFGRSQFNRAIQSRRQVGSTFKPIVYAAALETRKIHAASMIADAPLAFTTEAEFVWKPSNYGNDYMGNITLRKALALSRNTCTVRVLESIDPGMNNDVIYNFARKLGVGGPPTHALPDDWVASPNNDQLCPWTRETRTSTICMDRLPPKDPNISNTAHRAALGPDDVYMCRACDMSMGLGSASLTMEELVVAYSPFPTGGQLVSPRYVLEVKDRHGKVLETSVVPTFPQVMEPEVASISTWLLNAVATEGTAAAARSELDLVGIGGKTGTTNDEKDAWFIGFTNDVIAATWVGYDQPAPLGVSSTGGRTALPIWTQFMKNAAPKSRDRAFTMKGNIEYALIDEATGRRVSSGGRTYPFIRGTAPESSGVASGQLTLEDMTTDL